MTLVTTNSWKISFILPLILPLPIDNPCLMGKRQICKIQIKSNEKNAASSIDQRNYYVGIKKDINNDDNEWEDTKGISMASPPCKDEKYNSDYVGNIESNPPSYFNQLPVEWKNLLFQELDHDEDNGWTQPEILTPFVLDINNLYSHLVRMNKKIATYLWGDTECFSLLLKTTWYEYGFTCFSMKEKQPIGHCHLIQWKNITSSVDGKNYISRTAVYNFCIDVQRATRLCQKVYRFIIRVHQEDKYTHFCKNDHLFCCSHTFHVDFEKGQSDIIPICYKF